MSERLEKLIDLERRARENLNVADRQLQDAKALVESARDNALTMWRSWLAVSEAVDAERKTAEGGGL